MLNHLVKYYFSVLKMQMFGRKFASGIIEACSLKFCNQYWNTTKGKRAIKILLMLIIMKQI